MSRGDDPSSLYRTIVPQCAYASPDQLLAALVQSGVLEQDGASSLWQSMAPTSRPQSAAELASLMVDRRLLTPYQAMETLAGRVQDLAFHEYVILGRIGAGGMGQVFKAHHRRMDRIVALKQIGAKFTKDEATVKRFQREVRAAAKLSHPNIVTAHDAGEIRGRHFLVLEFVEGTDLWGLVKSHGPLSIKQAVDCTLQAAKGLAFAHSKGVIHRDVKPANLLLDQTGTVKVLDMGLAHLDDANDGLTGTQQVMGTADYMSPEQMSDSKHVDARADIYSLGCTLWFLLTDTSLYDGETLVQRIMQHREAPIPSLADRIPGVPPALDALFRRMVGKKPDERPESMALVAKELATIHAAAATSNSQDPPATDHQLGESLCGLVAPSPQPTTSIHDSAEGTNPKQYKTGSRDSTPSALIVQPIPADGVRRRLKRIKLLAGVGAAAILVLAIIIHIKNKNGEAAGPEDSKQSLAGPQRTESPVDSTPIDLLKMIDVGRDGVSGKWVLENDALLTPPDAPEKGAMKLQIPFVPPREFSIDAVVKRLYKGSGGLKIGFACDRHPITAELEGFEAGISGLDALDGKVPFVNETCYDSPIFATGDPARIHLLVRPGRIYLSCDGKTVIDWYGDPARLSAAQGGDWNVPDPKKLWLGSFGSKHRIEQLTLTPLDSASRSTDPQPNYPDRAAQEWVLSHGGLVAIGGRSDFKSASDLPPGMPGQWRLELWGGKGVHGNLDQLAGAKNLTGAHLWDSELDDGDLAALRNCPTLGDLAFWRAAFGDLGIMRIAGNLPRLGYLSVFGCHRVTDACWDSLAKTKSLVHLGLLGGNLSGKGCAVLHQCPKLTELVVGGNRFDSSGFAELAQITQLSWLGVQDSTLDDAGLRQLLPLTKLEKLEINSTAVTDDGLSVLANFPALEALWLDVSHVSTRGVENLAALQNLKQIGLVGEKIPVTDAAFQEDWLKKLPKLEKLHLVKTGVSDECVQRLKKEHPNLQITRE